MKFSDYEKAIEPTAIYRNVNLSQPSLFGLTYTTLGLNGEAGEVAEKVKKVLRDNDGRLTEGIKEAVGKELGDVLWYLSRVSFELGFTLEEVARGNLEKVLGRLERGKLGGNGDDR